MSEKIKYIIALSIITLFVLSIQSVDGRTMEKVKSIIIPPETFQIFEDGVTYTQDCIKVDRTRAPATVKGYDCAIIHEGKEYPCEFSRMHGGVITPMCIEIILKTMDNKK